MGDPFGSDQALLLILSWTISILSSYTMFLMISNNKRRGPASHRKWLIGGAAVFGFGFSTMQVIAMLAWNCMIIIDWVTALVVVLSSAIACLSFWVFGSGYRFGLRLPLGSMLLSTASSGLYYANLLGSPMRYYEMNWGLFVVSIGLCVIGSVTAFFVYERKKAHYKLISGLFFGCSSFAMVLFGLEALTAEYSEIMTTDRLNKTIMLMVAIIGFGTLLVLTFGLITWIVSKRFNQMDERYELLVENSIDMIAIVSQEQWEYVNKSGLRMFEADSAADLLGKSVFTFLHPKHHDELRRRLSAMTPESSVGPLEQEWYTARGKLLHTEVVETAATVRGRPAVQVIVRDISERKKNEELLINSEKLYVAGQLAAGIAHEIRNPLTSLKGFLQLLSTGRMSGKNYFDIMKSELNRIESIVSELLMLSKPQIYELAYYDTRSIVEDTVTLLAAQAIMSSIEIRTEYGARPLWVHGVENQIKQVIINVLKNAIEAMPGGGTIAIRCRLNDQEIIVSIIDQGPGIDEEQLAKMGQPFYTTKEKGTGLGLMVSYKIVDNHKGRIQAVSEIGIGTTVDIVLPYAEPADGGESAETLGKVTSLGQYRLDKDESGKP
jgi:two-component system sporulation sensor kinase A